VLIIPFRHKSVPLLDGLVSPGGGGQGSGSSKRGSTVKGRSRIPPSGRSGDKD